MECVIFPFEHPYNQTKNIDPFSRFILFGFWFGLRANKMNLEPDLRQLKLVLALGRAQVGPSYMARINIMT